MPQVAGIPFGPADAEPQKIQHDHRLIAAVVQEALKALASRVNRHKNFRSNGLVLRAVRKR